MVIKTPVNRSKAAEKCPRSDDSPKTGVAGDHGDPVLGGDVSHERFSAGEDDVGYDRHSLFLPDRLEEITINGRESASREKGQLRNENPIRPMEWVYIDCRVKGAVLEVSDGFWPSDGLQTRVFDAFGEQLRTTSSVVESGDMGPQATKSYDCFADIIYNEISSN